MTKGSSNSSSRVDATLVEKAVTALLKHHASSTAGRAKQALLGTDVPVQVQLGLEVAPGRATRKPMRLVIPHPVHEDIENAEVCLIVKEDSKEGIQEMIQNFPEHMGCIKKVLGLQSLRNKHAEYQQRRTLLAKYDVFMADDRILPMLTKALGKDFLTAKKQPIAVRITRREALPFAIRNALSSTYMTISEGTCVMVKAGHTGMPVAAIVENVVAVAEAAVPKIPRAWANIRSIAVKLPQSTSLPVYNKTPAQLLEIAEMAGLPSAWKKQTTSSSSDKSKDTTKTQKKRCVVEAEEVVVEESKRKTKSPLLKALKKQKQQQTETESSKEEQEERVEDETKKSSKKKKDKATSEGSSEKKKKKRKQSSEDATDGEVAARKDKKKKKSSEMEKMDDEGDEPSPAKKPKKTESSTFLASKKFKGSKQGYVFKNGNQGVGYYLDVPPVVDKMAMAALARMQKGTKKGGSRSGKHRRRKGR